MILTMHRGIIYFIVLFMILVLIAAHDRRRVPLFSKFRLRHCILLVAYIIDVIKLPDANLYMIFLVCFHGAHVIHDIIRFEQRVSDVPGILVLRIGFHYSKVALGLINSYIAAIDEEVFTFDMDRLIPIILDSDCKAVVTFVGYAYT